MTALADLVGEKVDGDGYTATAMPEVRLFCSSAPTGRQAYIYDPCICVVAQGSKLGHVHGETIRYDANNYLVNAMLAPFECESFGTETEPLLGLTITVNLTSLYDVVNAYPPADQGGELPRISGTASMDPALEDAVLRLVRASGDATDARILGPGIITEILYRVLQGSQGCMLQALANRNGAYARVARAIDVMHRDVASLLDIDGLADLAGMSASTFHRTFKRLCADSPLQYLKKLRLEKARGLIVHDGILVHQAAEQVGYESASQFSREFKRRYGCTPASLVNKGGSELLSA